MQICSKLLIEKMFYNILFCQTTHCPDPMNRANLPPPSMIKLANRPVCLGLKEVEGAQLEIIHIPIYPRNFLFCTWICVK